MFSHDVQISLVRRDTATARVWWAVLLAVAMWGNNLQASIWGYAGSNALAMPLPGDHQLRVVAPDWLEVTIISTQPPDPTGAGAMDVAWYELNGPKPAAFEVRANGQPVPVAAVGFKRRVLYAPVRQRDLRIGNHLYLKLGAALADGQPVEVTNPNATVWPATMRFTAVADPNRWSPAIHVNQAGYLPALPKKAQVGYYLGSLGEMPVDASRGFRLIDARTGASVFQGMLVRRPDQGFDVPVYQQVFEADFGNFRTPGLYRLQVPGLGASYPFWIDEGVAAAFARTYALGLYHQRCGTANDFPYTRHTHDACHLAAADVPTMAFEATQDFLSLMSSDYAEDPRHTAPQLRNVDASLYPFVTQGKVDVSRGHHDAGDYSKYTINSAGLIHHLVFAADAFPGAGALDNLGLPESGDGRSDLLQEAKWEADFLARMQDADGGFYFLVYPRDRKYESDVLPDQGDPQVVWPKTTAVTAAAVAALAQIASSPRFKQQFPADAQLYLDKAKKGWAFLAAALSRHGWDGAYQKITHYGDTFRHDDELVWAATEMFLATGDPTYHAELLAVFDPADPATRRWTWWRLFEAYGCAIRSYAFAARTGRLSAAQLDPVFLQKCMAELIAGAQDQAAYARACAYGTSFPFEDKGYLSAGWYFSSDRAFDLTVGYQLDPRPEFLEAIFSNLNYEGGANPVNVSFVTGLGTRRQREIVHQFAQNDHRVLPPSGIPLGNVQSGFAYLDAYQSQLNAISFPPDWEPQKPYPMYDRWGDSFNVTTEFVVVNQARSLGSLAYWMAQTTLRTQAWKAVSASINVTTISETPKRVSLSLRAPGLDLTKAQAVWEARNQEPLIGTNVFVTPVNVGPQWVELEAHWPDGRRVFAKTNFFAASVPTYTTESRFKAAPRTVTGETVALFHFDGDLADATGRHGSLTPEGNALLDDSNLAWMLTPGGKALRVQAVGDRARITLPGSAVYAAGSTRAITLEAMIYVKNYAAYGVASATLLAMSKGWNSSLELKQDRWGAGPFLRGGTLTLLDIEALASVLPPREWHRLRVTLDPTAYSVTIDDVEVARRASNELLNWGGDGNVSLELGNFDGWLDEVEIKSLTTTPVTNRSPVVTLTAPTNGVVFKAPALLTLSATASDPDGSVSSVRFFQDGNLLATDTTAPYSFVWSNVAVGVYRLTAVATDNSGAAGTSPAITIGVTNRTPTVSLTSPTNGNFFKAPARITLTAAATDPDGTISAVRFYQNGTLLAADTAAPYSFVWSNVAVGVYHLTALALDNAGATGASQVVTVQVTNRTPVVNLTSPTNGNQFKAPARVTLTAAASDPDGTISAVRFYRNGTLLATDTTAPYSTTWSNAAAGIYHLIALAIDNSGATGVAQVVTIGVTPNLPPIIALTSPTNGMQFKAPATFTLNAAASDPDGALANVRFYLNGFLMHTRTAPPYTYTLVNVTPGTYTVSAQATDTLGATASTGPVSVIVNR